MAMIEQTVERCVVKPSRSGLGEVHAMISEALIILMAEDDEGHAQLVKRNLRRSGVSNDIVHVRDGQEALDYLRREGPYAGRMVNGPLLLLLDINMPRLDGVQTLAAIKGDEQLAMLPVIMLTTTDDPREVHRCYELGCSVYITKPIDYEAFVEAVRRVGLLLQVAQIPRESFAGA
jgi:CheY-like chemotaxis protein